MFAWGGGCDTFSVNLLCECNKFDFSGGGVMNLEVGILHGFIQEFITMIIHLPIFFQFCFCDLKFILHYFIIKTHFFILKTTKIL